MRIAALASLVWLLLTGCSKSNTGEKDTVLPVITITTPVSGQTFTNGQSIRMTGTVTDNNYIAELHIHVYNNNTGALLMDVHLYPAAASAVFDQSLSAAAGTRYKIQVLAKDKAVNEARASVEVSCN
ncbi:MAG: Ig-like domain-containing protein [Chitinophagaceae bacterium]